MTTEAGRFAPLDYATAPADMSLTELHRQIGRGNRRQYKVAWLAHRARRLSVLKRERRARIERIAATWGSVTS